MEGGGCFRGRPFQGINIKDQKDEGKGHPRRLAEEAARERGEREDPPAPAPRRPRRFRGHLQVRQHREQHEEARRDVAALGDPGDRLGPERME